MIRDKFEEICPPLFVATVKSQEVDLSEKMAETVDLHFKAHGKEIFLGHVW